jgi:hypothetical protein
MNAESSNLKVHVNFSLRFRVNGIKGWTADQEIDLRESGNRIGVRLRVTILLEWEKKFRLTMLAGSQFP